MDDKKKNTMNLKRWMPCAGVGIISILKLGARVPVRCIEIGLGRYIHLCAIVHRIRRPEVPGRLV